MSDSDFTINTDQQELETRERPRRRPMPPGQTRHVYRRDGAEIDETEEVSVLADDNTVDVRPERPKRVRRQNISEEQSAAEDSVRRPKSREKIDRVDDTPLLVRFFMDVRIRIWLGIFFLLLGGIMFVILLSYLKTGALDQAVIMNMSPEEIVAEGTTIEGLIGPFGAWVGHVMFAEAFGIGAFVIACYFTILGWRLLRGRPFGFWGLTLRSGLLAVTISIVIGLITYAFGSTIFWGGIHGHYINKWLLDMTGVPGALFVTLLLIGTVITLYINELLAMYKRWKERREIRRAEKEHELEARRRRHKKEGDDEQSVAEETSEKNHGEGHAEINKAGDERPRIADEKENAQAEGSEENKSASSPAEKTSETVFQIDTPAPDAKINDDDVHVNNNKRTDAVKDGDNEPGFVIDAPIAELGKNHGTVAEKLVAENGEYDPRAELSRFKFPSLDLLTDHRTDNTVDTAEQEANKDRIIKTLATYNIAIDSIKATVGPTVTLYEIIPAQGIRIAQITRLKDDIAMSLLAKGIRMIAPMPGKGTVGIEVPNRDPRIVPMRTILSSKKFRESKAKLPVAIGATIANEIFVADLASMPHALVAGATGQGKSVGLNVLISSLLYRKHPSELKFVLIDPKQVEFSIYEQLRGHYLASLPGEEDAVVTDSSKVLSVLNSLCVEMDNRYALLRKASVNKIEDYNRKFCQRRLSIEKGHKYLPYIVVIIDEFADLIVTGGKEIEMPVMRITQKARAVGIHMIIATQRPSTNVLTGIIKANCPTRIAFRVQQGIDSRTILDQVGAEQLIGRGDMLYSQGGGIPERVQCAFISTEEIETICSAIDAQTGFDHPYELPEPVSDNGISPVKGGLPGGGMDRDPLFDEAARFIALSTTASTSSLQRRFEIGYNRAGKIMDQMEAAGIVGPASGSKPRSVLIDPESLERILANR